MKIVRGWKAIARYLGVSSRTARRRACDAALPVYQATHSGGVYAFEEELEVWLKAKRREVGFREATDNRAGAGF